LKQRQDVIVVGAGPAGATLAYELAKRGIGVLLLEKEKLPRYKCCAGGVTSKAAKLLDFDGQKVTQIQVSADWVEISTADNIFRSRLVVGADGAYSVVARELGMGRSMEYIAGIESEIVMPEEELAKWKSRAQMDLGCIPGGYAWVFPKRNHLSIGVGCLASKARHLNRHNQKFLNSLSIGSYTIARSSSHLMPTCTKERLVWQDKALLLGDAAGFADPLTGEGIYNAVQSAQLAAPVIENSLLTGKVGLQDYQQIVEKKIMSELRIARTLSKTIFRFPRLAFGMFNRSDEVWRAICSFMLGEIDYAAIKGEAGGFKGIFNLLFRA
jgi:flavin-dependent dehydrogenase